MSAAPAVSVVIPTRDRRPTLLRTLARLAIQVPPAGGFEVVVVDNGSTDGTPAALGELAVGFAVPLVVRAEPRPGPAAARNRGVEAARGDLVVFLGDDMEPYDHRLLAGHAMAHVGAGAPRAVMGRAGWNTSLPVTDFMRWLEAEGPQFDFAAMREGRVPPETFCTANVSLPRALLARAGGFDERFRYAALEDTELGVRLGRLGVELVYRPDLRVLHDHPTTFEGSASRMERVGASARLLHRLHPELRLAGTPVPAGARWRALHRLRPLAGALASERLPRAVRERAWAELHLHRYAVGYHREPGLGDG